MKDETRWLLALGAAFGAAVVVAVLGLTLVIDARLDAKSDWLRRLCAQIATMDEIYCDAIRKLERRSDVATEITTCPLRERFPDLFRCPLPVEIETRIGPEAL